MKKVTIKEIRDAIAEWLLDADKQMDLAEQITGSDNPTGEAGLSMKQLEKQCVVFSRMLNTWDDVEKHEEEKCWHSTIELKNEDKMEYECVECGCAIKIEEV